MVDQDNVPSFRFVLCTVCKRPVDRVWIERLHESGDYQVTAFCHDRRQRIKVSREDIEEHGGKPLVKIAPAFAPKE